MCKNKKGFTLIEILAVIIVLGITFRIVSPGIAVIINSVKDTETKLIEEKVLSSAKEYINNVDNTFYTKLIDVGDISYIYKSDLINSGLLSSEEVNTLNNFTAVKGELLENDKIKYTLEYINVEDTEYTINELYLMYQSLTDKIDNLEEETLTDSTLNDVREEVRELQSNSVTKSDITNMTDISNTNNIFLKNYPVGSVYTSISNVNPGTIFGGTWAQIKDTFLLGAGDTYTAGSTGGEASHTLTIDEMPSHYHYQNAAVYGHSGWDTYTTSYYSVMISYSGEDYHAPGTTQNRAVVGANAYTNDMGGSQPHNNMPPYLTVYFWKRTA